MPPARVADRAVGAPTVGLASSVACTLPMGKANLWLFFKRCDTQPDTVATPSFASSEFLVGDCAQCEKQVLTHVTFTSAGDEIRSCVHCDAVIDTGALRWADGDELETTGYGLIEARTCGNGGGCRAGGCGTSH